MLPGSCASPVSQPSVRVCRVTPVSTTATRTLPTVDLVTASGGQRRSAGSAPPRLLITTAIAVT